MDEAAQDDQGSKHRMITKMFNLGVCLGRCQAMLNLDKEFWNLNGID